MIFIFLFLTDFTAANLPRDEVRPFCHGLARVYLLFSSPQPPAPVPQHGPAGVPVPGCSAFACISPLQVCAVRAQNHFPIPVVLQFENLL